MTNKWIFNEQEIDQNHPLISQSDAFVYMIINTLSNKKYIGVKKLSSVRKQKGRKNRKRSVSDWENYWSSSDILKEDVLKIGEENFKRIILSFHATFGDARFHETKLQFILNVLDSDEYYNNCIGKYRKTSDRIIKSRVFSKEYDNLNL